MGRFVFKLPDVGEGTAEAELVGWHVKVGDTVAEDQIVADVMTDKATVEITAPVSGKVIALHGEPGAMVPVRGPLVEFEVEGAGNAEESPSVSPLRSEPPPPASRGEETVAASSPPHASGEGDRAKRGGGALDAPQASTGNYVFKLPDVGEGTAEAELVGWHVKVGDAVEEDQILADVMTDKATVEITSPVAGVVVALHGEPGKAVPVGGPLVSFNVAGKGNVAAPPPAPSVASPKGGGSTPANAQKSPPLGGSTRAAGEG
uniref:biotin/lipoyl-containing protein n=1 Tax=Brevundimonas aurantiaca TaxID=74316 RepID=UPI002FDEDBD5